MAKAPEFPRSEFPPRQSAQHLDAWLENQASSDWSEEDLIETAETFGFARWDEEWDETTGSLQPGMKQWAEGLLERLRAGVQPAPGPEQDLVDSCDVVMHLEEGRCGCTEEVG